MRVAVGVVAVACLVLFVMLNLALVANLGVCCADDGYFASTAKNLAWGFGYSTSLGYDTPHFEIRRFGADATTGPTLVLPVSAAIRVFGNRSWVPGAVQVTLWTLLLLAAWRALGSLATRSRATAVGGVFLVVSYAVSPYHMEHWYAMLGEVPAALAILLAVAVWAADPGSSRRSLAAGMLLSLAFLAKMLTLLYVATFLAIVVVVGRSEGRDRKRLARLLGHVVLGFLLPILAFETWKVLSLGPEGYLSQVRMLARKIAAQGASGAGFSATGITTRLVTFYTRFGVSLPGMLVLAVFGGAMAWKTGSLPFKRLYLALLAGVAVHASYWLALSIGWPRYFFVGIVLLSALVAIPYAALEGRAATALYSGALVLALLGTFGRVQYPISILGGRWFAPSSIRSSQESVVGFLDARPDRRPFIGQWWAPVADLEYLSRGVLNFKGFAALTPEDLSRRVLVVTNSRFDDASDKAFSAFVAACGPPILAAGPYGIHECGGREAPADGS
jgi:hypothetical protein